MEEAQVSQKASEPTTSSVSVLDREQEEICDSPSTGLPTMSRTNVSRFLESVRAAVALYEATTPGPERDEALRETLFPTATHTGEDTFRPSIMFLAHRGVYGKDQTSLDTLLEAVSKAEAKVVEHVRIAASVLEVAKNKSPLQKDEALCYASKLSDELFQTTEDEIFKVDELFLVEVRKMCQFLGDIRPNIKSFVELLAASPLPQALSPSADPNMTELGEHKPLLAEHESCLEDITILLQSMEKRIIERLRKPRQFDTQVQGTSRSGRGARSEPTIEPREEVLQRMMETERQRELCAQAQQELVGERASQAQQSFLTTHKQLMAGRSAIVMVLKHLLLLAIYYEASPNKTHAPEPHLHSAGSSC